MVRRYSSGERKFLLEAYIANGKDGPAAIAAFVTKFPDLPRPNKKTPRRLYQLFQETGSVANRTHKRRKKPVLNPPTIAKVKALIMADHQKPATETGQTGRRNDLDLSPSSFRRAVKQLKMHPFVLQVTPGGQNRERYYPQRLEFSLKIHDQPDSFFDKFITSDEKTFSLDEHLNRQTHRRYAEWGSGGPPNFSIGASSHSGSVNVWGCAIGSGLVYVDIIPQGKKIDGKVYHSVMVKFIKWLAGRLGCKVGSLYSRGFIFQQDGATVHTTRQNLLYLSKKFGTIVSRVPNCHQDLDMGTTAFIHWPSHSPDISPMDHWMWEAMKARVFAYPAPANIDELKTKIHAAAAALTPAEITRGVRAMRRWATEVIEKEGGYIK